MTTVQKKEHPIFTDYIIYSDGRVWSKERIRKRKNAASFTVKGKFLSQPDDGNGYKVICLYGDGTRSIIRVHSLVLSTFFREREVGEQCRHLDGNSTNNCLSNLRWGSAKENSEDREIHGRQRRGSRHQNAKLNELQVRIIKRLLLSSNMRQKEIGTFFGVSRHAITKINLGILWRHIA